MNSSEQELTTTAPDESILIREAGDGCLVVTLNRPQVLNAWTQQMQRRLTQVIEDFEQDSDARSLVLTGAGDAFCAGQDLNETRQFSAEDVPGWLEGIRLLYDSVVRTTKPVVAALGGVAAGSGYQFALLCDMRIAHSGVRLGQPEVRSGIPSITGMAITLEAVGLTRTRELMLSGRLMDAAEALKFGLLTKVVDRSSVLSESVATAQSLANLPRMAFAATKKEMAAQLNAVLEPAFAQALAIDMESWGAGEPQETARAFLSKS